MSYAISAALQQAVFQRLMGDAVLRDQVGEAIFDAAPSGDVPPTYVSIGPEEVRDRSDKTGHGAMHDFMVSVVTDASGFRSAKLAAGAVSDALVDADLPLSRGRLTALTFRRARALRIEEGEKRRIDLSFRAFVEDD